MWPIVSSFRVFSHRSKRQESVRNELTPVSNSTGLAQMAPNRIDYILRFPVIVRTWNFIVIPCKWNTFFKNFTSRGCEVFRIVNEGSTTAFEYSSIKEMGLKYLRLISVVISISFGPLLIIHFRILYVLYHYNFMQQNSDNNAYSQRNSL